MELRISNETPEQIEAAAIALDDFKALRELKIEIQFDTNNDYKAKFINRFGDQITRFSFRETSSSAN